MKREPGLPVTEKSGGAALQGLEQTRLWMLILAVAIAGTLLANVLGLAFGITIIFPHLLYLPIIIAVYRFPRREVAISIVLGLGVLYLGLVYLFSSPDLFGAISAASRTLVFIAIGSVVSYLTLHLREEEVRYRVLVERSPDGVVLQRRCVIRYVNPAALHLLGASAPTDLIGKSILEFVPPGQRAAVRDRMGAAPKTGNMPPVEMALVRMDGRTVDVESVGSVVYQEGIPYVQTILRDITERKQAEEELKRLARDLKRSNEELEQFAYVASHDLQEPVRTAMTFAQLVERRYRGRLDRDADEYLALIVNAGRQMQALITDLLEYSRITTRGREPQSTDSEAVLRSTLEGLRARIEESGAVVTHNPLPAVLADPSQLRQVFQNLIGNGIKFRREGVPPRVHVAAQRQDDTVRFSVADNGIGIEPQYFDRIFVIFQRLHGREKYSGTGIGLAVVKRIVERHGGRIWVESEPGKGTAFHFTLPAAV